MEKIASFKVNHRLLTQGLYISRTDAHAGSAATTFDLRFTSPNREPVMDMPAVHTIEHLGATYLRNCARGKEVVYFGPMGCRTGFYLVMFGTLAPESVVATVKEMCEFILAYAGAIPGATPEECGNYREQNLDMAKYYTARFLAALNAQTDYAYKE